MADAPLPVKLGVWETFQRIRKGAAKAKRMTTQTQRATTVASLGFSRAVITADQMSPTSKTNTPPTVAQKKTCPHGIAAKPENPPAAITTNRIMTQFACSFVMSPPVQHDYARLSGE